MDHSMFNVALVFVIGWIMASIIGTVAYFAEDSDNSSG